MLESYVAKWKLRDLIRSWVEFHDLVTTSLGSPEVSAEQERRFLELKARIAGRLPLLTSAVPPSMGQESQEQMGLMTDLLNRYRSLRVEVAPGPKDRTEFDRVWHQHYIFLNKLKGVPLGQKGTRVVGRASSHVPTGLPRHRMPRSVPGAHLLGFIVRLGIFVLFIYLLGRAFGIRWEAGGHIAATPPTSAGQLGHNVGGALGSFLSGATRFMDPVVSAYGPVLTLVMIGLLLLGVGYWVFVRG